MAGSIVFRAPEAEKPDPTLPFPGVGVPDTRARVVRKASRGTCWKSVFDMIRIRYKGPGSEGLEGRRIEKLASQRRKALTQAVASVPKVCADLNNPSHRSSVELQDLFDSITPEQVRAMLRDTGSKIAFLGRVSDLTEESVGFDLKFLEQLRIFSEQDEFRDLYSFLLTLRFRETDRVNAAFLMEFGLTPKKAYARDGEGLCIRTPPRWEEKPFHDRVVWTDMFVQRFTAELFDFGVSGWGPDQPIDDLIAELRRVGPLAVGGRIGCPYYPPEALKKMTREIEGHPIYYFQKGMMLEADGSPNHEVLLVGAERTARGKAFVYFIDPNDASDPAHPETQRVYCMSYDSFRSRMIDRFGMVGLYDRGIPSSSGWAYFGPATQIIVSDS